MLLSSVAILSVLPAPAGAQGLQVSYGAKGVQTLRYNGVLLEDVGAFPADSFHIWHMKATDANGNVLSSGPYGWGENNSGERWDAGAQTETYSFPWGTLATQFAQRGDNLDVTVTETNFPGSGVVFDGAEIVPLVLHFPGEPGGFNGYSQYAITTTGPGISVADFGSGVVTAVAPDESAPLYTGWKSAGAATYAPILTTTAPDGLATFLPHVDRPVAAGMSVSYTVSLRFTPEGVAAEASDAERSFAATYPSRMTWSDHRILGTAYLASSPSGDPTQPGGFPTNPRRWFNDASVDVTTPAGLQAFQDRVLAQAVSNVNNAGNLEAQGVITWDVEGEQYPQTTSYVCSPDQIAAVAPEMESVVSDPASPYAGQKLDDAYFRTMTAAGLRVGVCLRPQVFTFGANGTASQVFLSSNAAMVATLEAKARYANGRWGATIFYVDSAVNADGGVLDPTIFEQLSTDLPGFLFIPEESVPRDYAYTAPFYTFLFHGDLGTPASVRAVYPRAFGANLVNDVAAAALASATPQLTTAVAAGDILMGHADYWQANDPTLVAIYRAAGASAPAPIAPLPVTPVLHWDTPAAILYGTALSSAQLDATASVPGMFTYTPAAGSVPPVGTAVLTAVFVPADNADDRTVSTTQSLVVTAVPVATMPVIRWASPAAMAYPTALGAGQLNATVNIPGVFHYLPRWGTVLPAGSYVETATFTPADASVASVSASRPLTVLQGTPQLSWAAPAPLAVGVALSGAQLNATASVAGSFSYSPAAGTVLGAGTHVLTAVFTPADTVDYTSAMMSVSVVVNAAPSSHLAVLSPSTGATLSGAVQVEGYVDLPLDAAGTYLMIDGVEVGTRRVTSAPFVYALGTTTLADGPHTLQLWAHDIGNNTTISAPVVVQVNNGGGF